MENKKQLNIFGRKIIIDTKGVVVTLIKVDDEVVTLKSVEQSGQVNQTPLFVKRDFGVNSDEFIRKFSTENYKACRDIEK